MKILSYKSVVDGACSTRFKITCTKVWRLAAKDLESKGAV